MERVAAPVDFTAAEFASVRFGVDGLVPAIVQDAGDGVVLMLPGQPNQAEVETIRAAAQPLLDLLAERRLTRGSTS